MQNFLVAAAALAALTTSATSIVAAPSQQRDDALVACLIGNAAVSVHKHIGRGDDSHAAADKISHERGQAIVAAVKPMVLDHHVLALDVAGFLKAFPKCSTKVRVAFRRAGVDESNHWHRGLLRARRERPRGRTAEQRDEVAPPYAGHRASPASAPPVYRT